MTTGQRFMEHWLVGRDSPDSIMTTITAMAEAAGGELVVCFDYFDTIVTRCVEPEYTKVIAATLLSRLLKHQVAGEAVYRWRRDIERDLCHESASKTGELEFRYTDLCSRLRQRLTGVMTAAALPGIRRLEQDMLSIEIAVEKRTQQVCPEVLQVLQRLNEARRRVVLISDFYLPEAAFREIIRYHGLEHLFDRIYISSSCGMSKGSGRIFPLVGSDLAVEPAQLLMIGDNEHADVAMARANRLQTICLKRDRPGSLPGPALGTDLRGQRRRPNLFERIDLPPDLPFREFGISLWYFTHLLFEALHRHGRENVFFLSKEGEFLKKLFDRYQVEHFGRPVIRSHYLLASRKSTFIASLDSAERETFSRLLNHYRDLSIREFLQSLNFEAGDIDRLCQVLGADCTRRRQNLRTDDLFLRLLETELFQQFYEQRRDSQRYALIRYLDSHGVDYRADGLCLVDVGWKGSIQDNIFYSLGGEVAVCGYYLGSVRGTERSAKNAKHGLLFTDFPSDSPHFSVYNNNRSLFEMMLGASHGSADHYREPESESQAGISAPNRKGGATEGISSYVATREIPAENRLYDTIIKPLQEVMLTVGSRMNFAAMIEGELPAAAWFAQHHARMVYLPTAQEIDWFEKLYHFENFGVFEVTEFRATQKFTLFERLKHWRNIVSDPPVLESGVWPPIILRSFGVGFWQFFDGRRRYRREFGSFKGRGL